MGLFPQFVQSTFPGRRTPLAGFISSWRAGRRRARGWGAETAANLEHEATALPSRIALLDDAFAAP
jgi:hypothetical protein